MALVFPQQVTLYQAGDIPQGASFGNFLDAIDGKVPCLLQSKPVAINTQL